MNDLERVLDWTTKDEQFLDRVTAQMDPDRRAVLKAIVETRGNPAALAQSVAPEVLERVRARLPQPVAVLAQPLAKTWTLPADLSADQVAQQFLERYGVRLEELTGHATKAAAAARTAAGAIGGARAAGDAREALSSLESALSEMTAAVTECTHPEGASWKAEIAGVAREGADVVDAATKLRSLVGAFKSNLQAIERAFQSWADAPPAERATTAESMAKHVRAASAVVTDMKEQIAALAV